jgi:hypothetical protein
MGKRMSPPAPVDPRSSRDFRPELYPLCEGRPAPAADSGDPVAQRMLEFAGIYYRLNLLYTRLQEVRLGHSAALPAAIHAEIGQAVQDRDALEDRLAPEGFFAEAVIEGLVTTNLVFSHALKKSMEPKPAVSSSSFSLYVPMPQPGEDLEAHLRRHLGAFFDIPDSAVPAPGKAKRPSRKQAAAPSRKASRRGSKP